MSTPDLSLALGSVVYALTKVDGRLQQEEATTVRQLLRQEPHGDLALFAFYLRENCEETVENAYLFAIRCLTNNRQALCDDTKKRFVNVLIRVAEAHDEMSRKERELIQRFRRDIRRL